MQKSHLVATYYSRKYSNHGCRMRGKPGKMKKFDYLHYVVKVRCNKRRRHGVDWDGHCSLQLSPKQILLKYYTVAQV